MTAPWEDEDVAGVLVELGVTSVLVEGDAVVPAEGAEVGGGANESVSVTGDVAIAPTPDRTSEGEKSGVPVTNFAAL